MASTRFTGCPIILRSAEDPAPFVPTSRMLQTPALDWRHRFQHILLTLHFWSFSRFPISISAVLWSSWRLRQCVCGPEWMLRIVVFLHSSVVHNKLRVHQRVRSQSFAHALQEVEALVTSTKASYATWVSVVTNTSFQTPRLPSLPLELFRSPPNSTVEV